MGQGETDQDVGADADTDADERLQSEMDHHVAQLFAQLFHRRIDESFRQGCGAFLLARSVDVVQTEIVGQCPHFGEIEKRLEIGHIC